MFFMNKRGRDPSIQGLIVLIGIMIILYTIILPPCDKCNLLGSDCPDTCDLEDSGRVLLLEFPGDIGEIQDDSIKHVFESANLFDKGDPELKILSNSLEMKSGLFGSSDQNLDFGLDDIENLERLSLSFAVIESRGNLIITLNGKQIFNQDIDANKIETVELPMEYLEGNNDLELKVNPPGFAFWLTNKYSLKDITLKEEFELVHTSDVLDFSVSSSEKNSIVDSELRFYVYCKGTPGESNILKVHLNDNLLLSELMGCTNEDYSLDIDEDDFESGVNQLKFSVTGGNYLISDIRIDNVVSGKVYPSYTFYVSQEIYDDEDDFYLILDMTGDEKRGDIILNDEVIELDTSNTFKEYDVSDKIKKGNNFVEIRPLTDFRIDELKVGY
jgi:hypothetical protein